MSTKKFIRIPLILGLIGVALSSCAPRPASEEGEEDITVSQGLDAGAEENPTLQPADGTSAANDAFPFGAQPGKFSEEDIQQILSEKSPEEATQINLRFICLALLHFRDVYGRYPTEEEGLAIFLDPPVTPEGVKRNPIAQEILIQDGWKNPIQYRSAVWEDDLAGFEVFSWGPDGAESEDDIRPDYMEEIIKTAAMIEAGALEEMRAQNGE